MSDVLTISVEGHVAQVTLNRPEKHNAINLELFEALGAVGESLSADRSIRAVVLCGAGNDFCSGIDTSVFNGPDDLLTPGRFAPGESSPANFFQRAAFVWRELPLPVICAITGVAFGAGMEVALGADMRIAAPDARLSIMEIKWGLIPDMAITANLRDIMPADRAKDLAMTGRIVAGTEALQLGLVTMLHDDPVAAAMDKAADIASKSPEAVRSIKQLFDRAWHMSEADALRLEAKLQTAIIGSPNQAEAIQANLERRPAEFSD